MATPNGALEAVVDGGAVVDAAAIDANVEASAAPDGDHDAARLTTLTRRRDALMTDAALADCTIVVADHEYPCVRSVLAHGSSFFRAMFFRSDMAERTTGRAVLEGVSRAGWEAVREWLYTAKVCWTCSLARSGSSVLWSDWACQCAASNRVSCTCPCALQIPDTHLLLFGCCRNPFLFFLTRCLSGVLCGICRRLVTFLPALALPVSQKSKCTTPSDVVDIIAAADRLCVLDLKATTVADAVQSLSVDNVVALSNLSWSGVAALEELQTATFAFLQGAFDTMRERDDLCTELGFPVFSSLVSCSKLCVASESALLACVWRRLADPAHTEAEVMELLGALRLKQLDKGSLESLSALARGDGTPAIKGVYPALRSGVSAVVLRGLAVFSDEVDRAEALLAPHTSRRGHVAGASTFVLFDLHNQSGRVSSPDFHVGAHTWRLNVKEVWGTEGKAPDLSAFVERVGGSPLPVRTRVCLWAFRVDGSTFLAPSMDKVRDTACDCESAPLWLGGNVDSFLTHANVCLRPCPCFFSSLSASERQAPCPPLA